MVAGVLLPHTVMEKRGTAKKKLYSSTARTDESKQWKRRMVTSAMTWTATT